MRLNLDRPPAWFKQNDSTYILWGNTSINGLFDGKKRIKTKVVWNEMLPLCVVFLTLLLSHKPTTTGHTNPKTDNPTLRTPYRLMTSHQWLKNKANNMRQDMPTLPGNSSNKKRRWKDDNVPKRIKRQCGVTLFRDSRGSSGAGGQRGRGNRGQGKRDGAEWRTVEWSQDMSAGHRQRGPQEGHSTMEEGEAWGTKRM